jgi:RNA polymerase sigma-70 factor (ECF subfamily)
MNDIAALIEALMKAHASDLKRTAYVMLGDDALSEDVTQETFISFYKNYHQFRGASSHKTYLYRILMNHIKMHWRKRSYSTQDALLDPYLTIAFEEELVGILDLHQALRRIKPVYVEVITLFYFNGYSVDEIASILDISTSNVKMRLMRGRESIKNALTGGKTL